MEISAIGGECLAEQGHAHRTLALAGVSCHRESSAAATDSDGPMASGRVRSPLALGRSESSSCRMREKKVWSGPIWVYRI